MGSLHNFLLLGLLAVELANGIGLGLLLLQNSDDFFVIIVHGSGRFKCLIPLHPAPLPDLLGPPLFGPGNPFVHGHFIELLLFHFELEFLELPLFEFLQLFLMKQPLGKLHPLFVRHPLLEVLLALFVQFLHIVPAFELPLHQEDCTHLLHVAQLFEFVPVLDSLQEQVASFSVHHQEPALQGFLGADCLLVTVLLLAEGLVHKTAALVDFPLLAEAGLLAKEDAVGVEQTPFQTIVLGIATLIVHNYNESQPAQSRSVLCHHRARYNIAKIRPNHQGVRGQQKAPREVYQYQQNIRHRCAGPRGLCKVVD